MGSCHSTCASAKSQGHAGGDEFGDAQAQLIAIYPVGGLGTQASAKISARERGSVRPDTNAYRRPRTRSSRQLSEARSASFCDKLTRVVYRQ